MDRRHFLGAGAATLSWTALPTWAASAVPASASPRLLVLIELRGGNDGLNTVVPIHDGRYQDLRPRLALAADSLTTLAGGPSLHGALAPLAPLWQAKEMAVLQGVGYPTPNLSHFRSIEIWDTASDSEQFLQQGWISRAVANRPAFKAFSADGVVIGSADLGPLGGGARAVALADPARFARQSRLASKEDAVMSGSLGHLLRVESDIVRAGAELVPEGTFTTEFPRTGFGLSVQNGAAVAATGRVPVLRLTLSGFDTHQNQLAVQNALLRQFADGVVALRAALTERQLWQNTLVLTYSEFGRRPRENQSGGTDHGTASPMFAFGPGVKGGVYGEAPNLAALDENGNLRAGIDFRSVYASILQNWWAIDSERVLQRRFAPVDFIRT